MPQKYYSIRLFIFIISIIIISHTMCGFEGSSQSGSNKIILKIGDAQITENQLFKAYDKYQKRYYKTLNQFSPKDSINNWVARFIDETYFLADAMNMGIHEDEKIIEQVTNMTRYILTQDGGELYHQVHEKNIKPERSDKNKAYKKLNKKYHFDYLRFENQEKLTSAQLDSTGNMTNQLFKQYMMQSENDTNFTYDQCKIRFPSYPFWKLEDVICKMEPMEIAKPIQTSHGIYIVRLNEVETVKPKSFQEEKKKINMSLYMMNKDKFIEKYEQNIKDNAHIKINDDIVEQMAVRLNKLDNNFNLNMENFEDIQDSAILSYFLVSKKKIIAIRDVIYFYNRLIIKNAIVTKDNLLEFLEYLVIEDYKYQESLKYKVHQQEHIVAGEKNFKNGLIVDKYDQLVIEPQIQVTDDELYQYYNKNKHRMTEPLEIIAHMFRFSTGQDAMKSLHNLNKYNYLSSVELESKIAQNNLLMNALDYNLNRRFEKKDGELFNQLLGMKTNEISYPLPDKKNYLLLWKIENGKTQVQPYGKVKDELMAVLGKSKILQIKHHLLPSLKEKYSIQNKIDIEELMKRDIVLSS